MDSPHMQQTLTTLNKNIDEYKDIYSQFVPLIVDVHNYHLALLKNLGRDSGNDLRSTIRDARAVLLELTRSSRKITQLHTELVAATRAEKKRMSQLKKEIKEARKRHNELDLSKSNSGDTT